MLELGNCVVWKLVGIFWILNGVLVVKWIELKSILVGR